MYAITFRYLLNLVTNEQFEMRLMYMVTAYLYVSLDNDTYTKIPEEFQLPKAHNLNSQKLYLIKLCKSFGLKQVG